MNIKITASTLDTIASKDIDVSKDLAKDERSLASIKEILDEKKEKE